MTSKKYLETKPQINVNLTALENLLRRSIPEVRNSGKITKTAIDALYSEAIMYAVFGIHDNKFVLNGKQRSDFLRYVEECLEEKQLSEFMRTLESETDVVRSAYAVVSAPLKKGVTPHAVQKQKDTMLALVERIVINLSIMHQTVKLVVPYPIRSK